MSSTDYNYDADAQFFPFFILTVVGLVTIPVTYNVLKPSNKLESTAPRTDSSFQPEHHALIEHQKAKQRRRERKFKRGVLAISGWAIMAYMVYIMSITARTAPKVWNPYELLGVKLSATEAEIKRHYKKLSITQHPDKRRPDPANNLTVDAINEHWSEITKAFKALTDEEIRNNYIQYGHPDGKQGFSIGIALPQFIVTEGNGKYVLLVYAALLGVLLPYLVGKWWYGTQRVTREGILVESAGNIFREYKDDIDEGGIVTATSAGIEYKEALDAKRKDHALSKIEQTVLSYNEKHARRLSKSERDALLSLDDEDRRRILGLLWAYLNRVDLADAALNEDKYAAAPIAFALAESFTTMSLAFGNLQPLLYSYQVAQCFVQAIPPKGSPLLQLPHFTPATVKAIEAAVPDESKTVQTFMTMTEAKRRRLTAGAGLMTDGEFTNAMKVASQLPAVQLEKCFFKVTGEKVVTAGSLIQFVVKLRIVPPGTTEIPPVNELDLEDVDPKEGDLDALHGRKKKQVKNAEGKMVSEAINKAVQPPLAHAPYYARDHSPRWRVFLAESRQGKIAVPPFTFSTFERPLFNEDGTPTFNVQTLKMQFQAPSQSGSFPFTMHLMCDSYIGLDVKQEVLMVVEDANKAEEIEEEDEISEPEEDSLAGQMNALKTGGAPPVSRKKKAPIVEDSDESDSEEEEDEDTDSDTDTDTDEE
ncbi:hypothetical protein FH972_025666 [Carpinus fangiana]|uniref:J domain-containing protein n=1 Tax=Carpinus fangiana TaxID=176857 RepID=A0A5N6L2P2_9ROSI|nr:hypothetical protein FH972_025666 [Carpinus fangiana]